MCTIRSPVLAADPACQAPPAAILAHPPRPALFELDPVEGVPRRHIRQDHAIACFQPRDDFDEVHRASAELYLYARCTAVGIDFEDADRALLLTERRSPHIQ